MASPGSGTGPLELAANAVVDFSLSYQGSPTVQAAAPSLELRCGFFSANLELLDRAAGKEWVAVSEPGRRVEVRALQQTKSEVSTHEAILRFHLGEVPGAVAFLLMAVVTKEGMMAEPIGMGSKDAGESPTVGPRLGRLLLKVSEKGQEIHCLSRAGSSGGPGMLLLAISRGPYPLHAIDGPWHLQDIMPNSSSVVCGELANTVIRELYWPEVGVAIQRSSPDVSGGAPAVSWLEVFQGNLEGSGASSDDDVSVSLGTPSPTGSAKPSSSLRPAPKHSFRPALDAASSSDSELELPLYDGSPEAAVRAAGAKIAVSTGALSPEFFWPRDSDTRGMNDIAKHDSKIPRFGTSPSVANTSPSQCDESPDHQPVLLLGSPTLSLGGPLSLPSSPLSANEASPALENGRHASAYVVEQPYDPSGNTQRRRPGRKPAMETGDGDCGGKAAAPRVDSPTRQQERSLMRSESELHARELATAAKHRTQLEEQISWAMQQLSDKKTFMQQTQDVHAEELKVMAANQCSLEQRLHEVSLRDSELTEESQHTTHSLQNVKRELQCSEERYAEHANEAQEGMASCMGEIQDLRCATDLQKSQLSQSQALAAELRAEAMNLCEERDKNLAEAYAEKVRAGQLQEQLSKEQSKLAAVQASAERSAGSDARPACSLVTLQQRLQEVTLEADRERRSNTQTQHAMDDLREENSLMLRELRKAEKHAHGHQDIDASLREEAFELKQSQAYVRKLANELRAEGLHSQSIRDEMYTESFEVLRCRSMPSMQGRWEEELAGLRSELRDTEHEFHAELASVHDRLSMADQRNRRLCESLRNAMHIAGTGGGDTNSKALESSTEHLSGAQSQLAGRATSEASDAPASPSIPAPKFLSRASSESCLRSSFSQQPTHGVMHSGPQTSSFGVPGQANHQFAFAVDARGMEMRSSVDAPSSGSSFGHKRIERRQPGYVPRAADRPPMSLEGDHLRFVDSNSRALAMQSVFSDSASLRNSSAASSPRGGVPLGNCMLRTSHSHTGLPGRSPELSYVPTQSKKFLNDVSEGAPELGLGPGGPGATSHSAWRAQLRNPLWMPHDARPQRYWT